MHDLYMNPPKNFLQQDSFELESHSVGLNSM